MVTMLVTITTVHISKCLCSLSFMSGKEPNNGKSFQSTVSLTVLSLYPATCPSVHNVCLPICIFVIVCICYWLRILVREDVIFFLETKNKNHERICGPGGCKVLPDVTFDFVRWNLLIVQKKQRCNKFFQL